MRTIVYIYAHNLTAGSSTQILPFKLMTVCSYLLMVICFFVLNVGIDGRKHFLVQYLYDNLKDNQNTEENIQ